MSNTEDIQFIAKFNAGDAKSLEFLIQKYLKSIYNFFYRHLNNSQDAEDLTQQTFLKTWKNLDKFDTRLNFKVWLFSIAHNSLIDFFKKKKTIPFSEFTDDEDNNPVIENIQDPEPLPSQLFCDPNLAQKLETALEKIPSKYKEILLLRYFEEFSFNEIAQTLKEPLNTIKSRHRRALERIRKEILEPPL